MGNRTARLRRTSGLNFVQLLVVVAIVGVLIVYVLPRYMGSAGPTASSVRGPIAQARDTVCRSNLDQIRSAIQTQTIGGGSPPSSLSDLALPPDITKCPSGGEPYRYDASTGRVSCPHPGHEGY